MNNVNVKIIVGLSALQITQTVADTTDNIHTYRHTYIHTYIHVIAYADDLMILVKGTTQVETENYANTETHKVANWARNN